MRVVIPCVALTLLALGLLPVWAKAPAPVDAIAPVEDLVFEVDAKIKQLDGLLASADAFEGQKELEVWQAFSVISVFGQAVAEHPQSDAAKFSGPALREAAKKYTNTTGYDDAKSILAAVKEARAGGGAKDAPVEHEWNKLTRMHPMMEEINGRNAKLVQVITRPRGRREETMHATTIAILSLAMYADTHEVKNPADIPEWQKLATEYRQEILNAREAVKAKDSMKARMHFDAATKACDVCHEKFRDI